MRNCVTISCKIYNRHFILKLVLGVCLTVSGGYEKTSIWEAKKKLLAMQRRVNLPAKMKFECDAT